VHRRFQTWCRDEVLRRALTDVANELRDRGALNEEECFIDATFVMAKGGGLEIGATKRGKGMKIMAKQDHLSASHSTSIGEMMSPLIMTLSFHMPRGLRFGTRWGMSSASAFPFLVITIRFPVSAT
jgi:hypothetical protein